MHKISMRFMLHWLLRARSMRNWRVEGWVLSNVTGAESESGVSHRIPNFCCAFGWRPIRGKIRVSLPRLLQFCGSGSRGATRPTCIEAAHAEAVAG